MVTTKLSVPDMSCGHCEQAVLKALVPVEGVDQVQVDLPTKIVTVTYDPAVVGLDKVSDILAAEYYPVASVIE
ncbi:MAG: heavy-metal-associated domain-containing protein [Thermomicrobiales bacterium]|nr:heavy-metal-associated domain-containing protein [Thermomicrobiales bacterium]MCO5220315.1 heavy-metal-associated domain-containing protein [Thermomicrobiales bacterium]